MDGSGYLWCINATIDNTINFNGAGFGLPLIFEAIMAAQELTWDMTQLIVRWREDTGLSQTADILDNDVAALLNDYYGNYFWNANYFLRK